jgi:hypothetical protein
MGLTIVLVAVIILINKGVCCLVNNKDIGWLINKTRPITGAKI